MAKEQMTVTLKKRWDAQEKDGQNGKYWSQGCYILWPDGREFRMYNNGPNWFTQQQENTSVTVMGEWKENSKGAFIACKYGEVVQGVPPAAAPAPAQAPAPAPAPAPATTAPAPATAAPPVHNAAQPAQSGYDEYSADPVRMGRGCSLKAFAAALAEIMPWEFGAYVIAGEQYINTGVWNPPQTNKDQPTGAGPVDEQPEQQPQNPGEGEWE